MDKTFILKCPKCGMEVAITLRADREWDSALEDAAQKAIEKKVRCPKCGSRKLIKS